MAGLLDSKYAQERRRGVLETWTSDATSTLSQEVLSSRFDAFVQSRFAETEKRAQDTVCRSVFGTFVISRINPVERMAIQSVSSSKFGYCVLQGARPRVRIWLCYDRSTSEVDPDVGGLAQSAKEQSAKRTSSQGATAHSLLSTPMLSPLPRTRQPRAPTILQLLVRHGSVYRQLHPTNGTMQRWPDYSVSGTNTWVPLYNNGLVDTLVLK